MFLALSAGWWLGSILLFIIWILIAFWRQAQGAQLHPFLHLQSVLLPARAPRRLLGE